MPDDASYQVIIEVTDDGEMETSKVIIGGDDNQPDSTEPKITKIAKGEFYEMALTTGRLTLLDKSITNDLDKKAPIATDKPTPNFGDIAVIAVSVIFVGSIVILNVLKRRQRRRR
jgi:hypothetical protein